MFLHLGGDVIIDENKIVAILDLETLGKGSNAEHFLKMIKKLPRIFYASDTGKEKSLVITIDAHYFSPISSTTLLKRSLSIEEREE